MLQHILPRLRQHNNYTEAFFGGGAVFFAKQPAELETINDINNNVVNFYEVLQTDFEKLQKKISLTLASRYQLNRAIEVYHNKRINKVDRAWAFWVATNLGFSNKIGGGLKWSNIKGNSVSKMVGSKKDRFTQLLQTRIENAIIENKDAIEVLEGRDSEITLHYVDPPYVNCHQGHYGGYALKDYQNLLETLATLKGGFVLSCFPDSLLDEFIANKGWYVKSFDMHSSAKDRRVKVNHRKTELLVSNYDMDHHLQLPMFDVLESVTGPP